MDQYVFYIFNQCSQKLISPIGPTLSYQYWINHKPPIFDRYRVGMLSWCNIFFILVQYCYMFRSQIGPMLSYWYWTNDYIFICQYLANIVVLLRRLNNVFKNRRWHNFCLVLQFASNTKIMLSKPRRIDVPILTTICCDWKCFRSKFNNLFFSLCNQIFSLTFREFYIVVSQNCLPVF